MKLSIVIVNYKTPELVINCLKSIKDTINLDISYEIIVVDNNSDDNSESVILKAFPNLIWINKIENDGFGRANNIGISKTKGKYILLLNSDVVVCNNTINESLKYLEWNPNVGVLGCKLLNEDSSLQKSTYYNFANLKSQLERNLLFDYFIKFKSKEIKGIMGSFMLIPIHVIDKCGLFDPDFFMYSEEMELCNRILKNGYKIKYLESISAFHLHGASSSCSKRSEHQRLISNALLVYKLHGLGVYILYFFLGIINTVTNFMLMWFIDKGYRKGFFQEEKTFYCNFNYYFTIPFKYTRKIGNGQNLLRRNKESQK